MMAGISYYWRLWRLRREDRFVERAYRADRVKAKKENKGWDALERLQADEWSERRLVQDQIAQLRTGRLWREASRFDIPVPKGEDAWEESSSIGGRHLTASGFHNLRAAIRKEKNERWTYWEVRLKVLTGLATALTGATGALIGLVAIWSR